MHLSLLYFISLEFFFNIIIILSITKLIRNNIKFVSCFKVNKFLCCKLKSRALSHQVPLFEYFFPLFNKTEFISFIYSFYSQSEEETSALCADIESLIFLCLYFLSFSTPIAAHVASLCGVPESRSMIV